MSGSVPAPGGTLHGRAEQRRAAQSRHAMLLVLLIALALLTAGVCGYVDYVVYARYGLDGLDNTISAETALIGAVLGVAGALVGAWTFLKPKWTSG